MEGPEGPAGWMAIHDPCSTACMCAIEGVLEICSMGHDFD
jgi:hypothetical protein